MPIALRDDHPREGAGEGRYTPAASVLSQLASFLAALAPAI